MGTMITPEMIAQLQAQGAANQQQSSPQSSPQMQGGAPTAVPGVAGVPGDTMGNWSAPQSQQSYAQPATPTPPSAQASMLPPPQFADPQHTGSIKSLLTRIVYGGGQAMLAHVGLPTDFDLQKNQFNQDLQQSELALRQQQQQYSQSQTPVVLPNGTTVLVPQGQIGKVLANSVTGQYGLGKQELANQGKMNVANIQFGANLPLDPTVAQLIGQPQMAGKLVGKAYLGVVNQMLTARGISKTDTGQGVYLTDRGGNRLARLGDSPGVARAFAYGQARAQFSPFETLDDQGNVTTTSALNAIQQGLPGIGRPNATQVLGKAALLGDIRGGISQVRELTDVLDDPKARAKIAALLASFGTTGQFLQSGLAGSLDDPRQQDYVMAVLNLKENAMAMRSTLGAGQGSEDLRAAIQRTIPGASTPGSSYANRQLDLANRTLDRLATGIPSLGAPTNRALSGGGTQAPNKGAAGGGGDFFSNYGGKKH